jgi:transposase
VALVEKKARAQGRQIVFVDESGLYLTPGPVRSYAPCASPQVLRTYLTRDHLSVISAVTPAEQLLTHLSNDPITSVEMARFVLHLLEVLGCPLLLIWDGSPIHRAEVDDLVVQVGANQLWIERLPAYAPDLNPDEGVWQHLKHVELRNVICFSLRQLRWQLRRSIMRLRSKPWLIRSFFAGAGLSLE